MLREQDNSSGRTGTSGSQETLENEADDRGDEEEDRDRENDEDSDGLMDDDDSGPERYSLA